MEILRLELRRAAHATATATAAVTALGALRLVMFGTRDVRELGRVAPDVLDALLAASAQEPQGRAKRRRPAPLAAPAAAVAA